MAKLWPTENATAAVNAINNNHTLWGHWDVMACAGAKTLRG